MGTTTRRYLYSTDGIMGFEENGVLYLYRKNLFGDITAIYQGSTKVAEYEYDAWGNCTIIQNTNGIGTRNPFRYRSYYFDTDLEMYYLLTRYYDPKTGRFINADSLEYLDPNKINGLNLYAYCRNNPIMYVDPNGCESGSTYLNYYLFHALIALILGLGLVFADKFPKTDNSINTIDTDIPFEFGPLWESEWDSKLSEGKIIDGQLHFLKGYKYLDTNQNHSIYISFLNISAFLGAFFNEKGFNLGGELAGSLIDIGYEGRYIDITIPLFGIGAIAAFQNGTLEFGIDPLSTIGLNIAIHFDQIFADIWKAIKPQ